MKTNMTRKSILAVLVILTVCLFSMTAFAAEETQAAEAAPAENSRPEKGYKPGPRMKDHDWFEDWFEDRIEGLEDETDFSELPDELTEEEMIEFFKKHFMGENRPSGDGKKEKGPKPGDKPFGEGKPRSERPEKKDSGKGKKQNDKRSDRYEDWFEDRIEARKHDVDFSELPENPTDEEIVEFFRKYFMDGDKVVTFGKHGDHKRPDRPMKPETAPEAEIVPEITPETEAAPEDEIPQENTNAAPAEEQPAAETDNAA